MDEYTHAHALELQRQAWDGDLDACDALLEVVRPYAMRHVRHSTLPKDMHMDVWHDIVVRLVQRIATGHFSPYWRCTGYYMARKIVRDIVRAAIRRTHREEAYMEAAKNRVAFSYPALHKCIALLEPLPQDLIRRMYFRPVRQNMMKFSEEHDMNYYSVRRMHFGTLDALRCMLEERGIYHA